MTMHPKTAPAIAPATWAALLALGAVSRVAAAAGDTGSVIQPDRWRNAAWAVGLFLLLLVILGKFFWKPVQRAILAREQALADVVSETARRKAESEELLLQYTERLSAAEQDVARMLERSQAEAEATREKIIDQAKKQAAVVIAEAQRQIVAAKKQALSEIYQDTASLATDVASKIVRREIAPGDHARLVEEGLKRIEKES